jgi:type IV pilus assembly protein PilF
MKIFELRYRILLCLLLGIFLSACANRKLEGMQPENNPTSENMELQKRAAIRLQLAVDYYQQGQYKVALEEVRQALLVAPDLVDAYSVRALIFMDTNDAQRAEDNFLHALKLSPNNSDISNNYGWFLCQNGREKESIQYFEKALKDPTYPTPVKVLGNAGVCSLRLKDNVNAERYFMQGFREQPANPSINANLAKVFYDKGEYDKAKFYIGRVVKAEIMAADVLWLAVKIENKLGDQLAVTSLGTQLRRRHPNSKEYGLFQRGAFNE